jgi:hypothetical protein
VAIVDLQLSSSPARIMSFESAVPRSHGGGGHGDQRGTKGVKTEAQVLVSDKARELLGREQASKMASAIRDRFQKGPHDGGSLREGRYVRAIPRRSEAEHR